MQAISPTDEFNHFISLSNFQLAWRRIRNSNQHKVKDRLGLKIYAAQTDEILKILINRIQTGGYVPQTPKWIHIPKRDGGLRPYPFLAMPDRIVYQALGNIILHNSYDEILWNADQQIFAHIPTAPNADGTPRDFMFKRAYGNSHDPGQFQKFQAAIINDIRIFSDKPDTWIVKTDIASFYPSIHHSVLLKVLEQKAWLRNQKLIDLLKVCLTAWATKDNEYLLEQGIPIGYETSDLLANLLLIEMDEHSSWQTISRRRYVDDMYFFVEGERQTKKLLKDLDFTLSARGLTRNRDKTKAYPCDESAVEEHTRERGLRKQASFIDDVLDDEYFAPQEELLELLRTICFSGDSYVCNDVQKIKENSSIISFVLNRLTYEDIDARGIAVTILEEFPALSFSASKYLLRFNDDQEIFELLFSKAADQSEFSEVRINCARALIEMCGLIDTISDMLVGWLEEEDSHLQMEAAKLLSDIYPNFDFWLQTAKEHCNEIVRAIAFYEAYKLRLNDEASIIDIVNLTWNDDEETVRLLGIYIRRRQAHIPTREFGFKRLDVDHAALLRTLDEQKTSEVFYEYFSRIFDYEVDHKLGIEFLVDNLESTNQHLLDMADAQTDAGAFVSALYDFTYCLLTAIAKYFNPAFGTGSPALVMDELHSQDEEFVIPILHIQSFKELYNAGKIIELGKKQYSLKACRKILAVNLRRLHLSMHIPVPKSLDSYLQKIHANQGRKPVVRDKVFISYSHKDRRWFSALMRHLNILKHYVNLSVWSDKDIQVGEIWRNEIRAAIDSAKIAVLLVSADFLTSEFIAANELPPILEASKNDGLIIYWILVKACPYELTPVGNYQAAHNPETPLSELGEGAVDVILTDLARNIHKRMKEVISVD